jgi:imidazolonepropionase-like amidohydrolase
VPTLLSVQVFLVPEKEIIIEALNIIPEEYKQYEGKNVAIYKGKIVAAGRTSSEAFKKAKEKLPEAKTDEIIIDYIQSADVLIL